LKINFVTKSYKVEIFKKHHINHFLVGKTSKEKNFKGEYVFESCPVNCLLVGVFKEVFLSFEN